MFRYDARSEGGSVHEIWKKKWRFYDIDGFKMGDFQIRQSDVFSILWNFRLEKAVVFC